MPWQIKQGAAGCKGYAVVKEGTGELVGCHPSKSKATAHLRALYASEADSKKINKSILKGDK